MEINQAKKLVAALSQAVALATAKAKARKEAGAIELKQRRWKPTTFLDDNGEQRMSFVLTYVTELEMVGQTTQIHDRVEQEQSYKAIRAALPSTSPEDTMRMVVSNLARLELENKGGQIPALLDGLVGYVTDAEYEISYLQSVVGLVVNEPGLAVQASGGKITISPANDEDVDYHLSKQGDEFPHMLPSATIKATIVRGDTGDTQRLVDTAVLALRMYADSTLRFLNGRWLSPRLDQEIGRMGMVTRYLTVNHLVIEAEEFEPVSRFIAKALSVPRFNAHALHELPAHLSRGVQCHDQATRPGTPGEEAVARAVAGLEALLTENKPELGFRLRKRVSILLRYSGIDPFKVDALMNMAYAVRSKVAHGDEVGDKDRKKCVKEYGSFERFVESVVDLVRVCLLTLFPLSLTKDEVIKALDDAMIDPASDAKNLVRFEAGISLATCSRLRTLMALP